MEKPYILDKTFDKEELAQSGLVRGEYENCVFNGCDLSNKDLSGICFTECVFQSCNLSLAKLGKTGFRDIRFRDCKLMGLHFENCDEFLFSIHTDNCVLDLSSFFQRKLRKSNFKKTSLQEVDFTEADLSGAVFDECDLSKAIFYSSNLEGADLRTSIHYSIDPEANRLKKAKFSLHGIAGLLGKYDIEIYP